MTRAMRAPLAATLLAALISASGCATKPPTPEERAAVWLSEGRRTLSLHVDRDLPQPELRSRDYKVGARIGQGAVTGVGMTAYGIGEFCISGGPIGCVVGFALTPVWFIGGAVIGAAKVDSVDSYQPIEAANGAPALFALSGTSIDLPSQLERSVADKANASVRHAIYPEQGEGQHEARPNMDGELRLSVRAFELFGDVGEDPSVALVLRVRADMRTADTGSLHWGDFTYESPAHHVSAWKADEARPFREEIDSAVRDIATQIADKLGSSPSTMAIARVSAARSRTAAAAKVSAPEPVALAAPSQTVAQSANTAIAGLLAVGTSWSYEFSDRIYGGEKTRIEVKVVGAYDKFVYEEVSANSGARQLSAVSRTIDAGAASFDQYRINGDAVLTEFAPYLLAAGGEGALKAVAAAKGYPTSGYSGWVVRTEPAVWEQVTVPAGTFRALRFEIRGRREISPFSPVVVYSFSIRVWYAPEVKRYVRLEHKTWPNNRQPNGDDVVELVEYHPQL